MRTEGHAALDASTGPCVVTGTMTERFDPFEKDL
jgi:hypothetical protein